MNEKYEQFKKQIKHIFSHKSAKRELYNVTRVWLVIVTSSTFVSIVLCVVAFYLFFFVYIDNHFSEIVFCYEPPFDSIVLKDVVSKYRSRTNVFNDEKNNLKSVPSVGISIIENEDDITKYKKESDDENVSDGIKILQ